VGLTASSAAAQVHWDIGAGAGGGVRVRSATTTPAAGVASVDVHGHIALIPLVRIGASFEYEDTLNPSGSGERQYYGAAVRAKVSSPWTKAPWRLWAFVGASAAYVAAPHGADSSAGVGSMGDRTSAADGGVVELPVGLGAGYRTSRTFELEAIVSARPALTTVGPVYRPPPGAEPYAGHEALAVLLTVGVSFYR
jgi:hypothetical protein